MSKIMNSRNSRTIRRILKVNHAGEYGAIRIYRAQIFVARRWYPEIMPFLEETLSHEIQHAALFHGAMSRRDTRPCYVMSLWANGGFILGFFTAMLGRESIWICTAAVEATVHRHLQDQLLFLRDKDAELHSLIVAIQQEELTHLSHAEERIEAKTSWSKFLEAFISRTTDALIWLSTWGDSTKMARELAASRNAS